MSRLQLGAIRGTFIERECILEHEGRKYESGGAWIGAHRDTGRLGGLLYVHRTEGQATHVGSWGDSLRLDAYFGRTWRSGWGDERQVVYFTYVERPFYGIWYKSAGDFLRCWETRKRGEGHRTAH